MTRLLDSLEKYLQVRRAYGFRTEGDEARLRNFVAFMETNRADVVTAKLAIEWATSAASQATWTGRLSPVRSFAKHLANFEPRTEIPPTGVFPQYRRPRPYIYSEAEIEALLDGMMSLPPATGLRRWTYHCCIGLLAVTGLRLGEAIRLRRSDVDLDEGVLTIRQTKFGKSRFVPVHPTTVSVLKAYAERRDASRERRQGEFFLVGEHGRHLHKQNVELVVIKCLRRMDLRGSAGTKGPRIHDLRHTYAVRTLVRWYRAGGDVERLLPVLSTYLGHTHTRDTYWYLTACPELMGHAVDRLESRWEVAQ